MIASNSNCLLLVDDDPRNLLALEAVLAPHGHRLVHAQDGMQALDLFDMEEPDVVLCDLVMPGTDGLEVLGRIRAHPLRGHTPVIMITAHTDGDQRLRALRAGADEFLEKPIDPATLAARVSTLLRLKQSRDDLAARHAELQRLQTDQRALMEFVVHDMAAPRKSLLKGLEAMESHARDAAPTLLPTLADMRDALDRVATMVGDLSWVTQLESTATPVRRSSVVLNDLIHEVVRMLVRSAAEKNISVDISLAERVTAPADERLVRRVLENLVDNAIRYAPEGGSVLVELLHLDGAEIRVHNDGPAIASVERERIFEKFVRGATDPPSQGHAGLGLYFCKRAIDAHQGEIAVIDAPGWSTSFSVWLPAPE